MLVSKWNNSLAVRLRKTKADRRRRALDRLAAHHWELPEGYRFNRDEVNER